jgi:hypothetical protein
MLIIVGYSFLKLKTFFCWILSYNYIKINAKFNLLFMFNVYHLERGHWQIFHNYIEIIFTHLTYFHNHYAILIVANALC